MKQLLRRLMLALSLAGALVGAQLVAHAGPAYARADWPPVIESSGICEDGTDPFPGDKSCEFHVIFSSVLDSEFVFEASTLPGTALPKRDYVPLDRERVLVPAGINKAVIRVLIVSDGMCEQPETFVLQLSTLDTKDRPVDVEQTITDAAC